MLLMPLFKKIDVWPWRLSWKRALYWSLPLCKQVQRTIGFIYEVIKRSGRFGVMLEGNKKISYGKGGISPVPDNTDARAKTHRDSHFNAQKAAPEIILDIRFERLRWHQHFSRPGCVSRIRNCHGLRFHQYKDRVLKISTLLCLELKRHTGPLSNCIEEVGLVIHLCCVVWCDNYKFLGVKWV